MTQTETQGGIRPQRVEFVRETEAGVTPSNPAWEAFSDTMNAFEWAPTTGAELRRGIGDADPSEAFAGAEAHELTVGYDLQRFPVDGAGDPVDASGDGLTRKADNSLPNSHTVVAREELVDLPPGETVDGWGDTGVESGSPVSRDTRIYTVALGGRVGTVTYGGDPGSEQPVVSELAYTAEKVREYQLDQPTSDTTLDVRSTDGGDTSQSVTLEEDSGGNQETLALSGTTPVTTAGNFSTLDAVYLDADTNGDVVVTDGSQVLAIIRGSNHFGWVGDAGEGDRGVPALGTGSHAGAVGSAFEQILDDTVERPAGTDLAFELNSIELSVENNLETRERVGTPRMGISAGARDATLTTSLVGPTETVKSADAAFSVEEVNLIWTLTGGSITLTNSVLTDYGGVTKEVGQAALALDNTFTAQGLAVST